MRCPTCSAWADPVGRVCPECDSVLEPDARPGTRSELPSRRPTPTTAELATKAFLGSLGLAYLCVLLLDHGIRRGGRPSGLQFLLLGPHPSTGEAAGVFEPGSATEWWRVLSSAWVHGGPLDLAISLWVGAYAFRAVTSTLGWTRAVVTFVAATVASRLAVVGWLAWVDPSAELGRTFGSAAGTFGLLAVLVVLRVTSPDKAARGAGWMLAGLLALSFVAAEYGWFRDERVEDGAALVVGLCFAGAALVARGASSPRTDRVWKLAALVSVAAVLVSFAVAVHNALGALA